MKTIVRYLVSVALPLSIFARCPEPDKVIQELNDAGDMESFSVVTRTDFSNEDWSGCDFSTLEFDGRVDGKQTLVFENANITGASFDAMPELRIRLKKTNAAGAHFSGADIYQASFEETNLDKANFEYAVFTDTELKNKTSLNNAQFGSATIINTRMDGVNGAAIGFVDTSVSGLHIANSHLPNVNFTRLHGYKGSPGKDVVIESSTIEGAFFNKAIVNGFMLKNCLARGISFDDATLSYDTAPQFVDSDLIGARFVHTNVRNATFSSRVGGAIFDGADITGATVDLNLYVQLNSLWFAKIDKAQGAETVRSINPIGELYTADLVKRVSDLVAAKLG